MTESREQLVGQIQRPGQKPESVTLITKTRPKLTLLERSAGIQHVDQRYVPGDVRRYFATGDGTTDDATALQDAVDGSEEVFIHPSLECVTASVITVPTTCRRIYGGGTITQNAEDTNVLSATSNTGLIIEGIRFQGATTSDQTSTASSNDAIRLISCDEAVIRDCHIRDFRYFGVYLQESDRTVIQGNRMIRVALPIRLRASDYCTIVDNIIDDSAVSDTVFTVGIGLDSTDGHALGICNHTAILSNIITNLSFSQGILVHAGRDTLVSNNIIEDCAMGISINPFNSTDNIDRIIVSNNVYEGPSAGTFTTNANIGITAQAGGTTPDINRIVIANNVVRDANRVRQNTSEGGIRVGYTVDSCVTGNVVYSAYANGIVITADEDNLLVANNNVTGTVAVSTTERGILVDGTGVIGTVRNNYIADIDGGNGIGIDLSNTSANLTVRDNDFYNVDTEIANADGAVHGRIRTITTGTSVDLSGVDGVLFNHAGATTVSTFTGVEVNKVYSFRFSNGNTTINRSNAFLDGGVNITGTADDVMLMLGQASDQLRQAAPISANS